MLQNDALRTELKGLDADLASSTSDHRDPPKSGSSDWISELDQIVLNLGAKFAQTTEDAEDLASAHPLAAFTTALLLGFVIGRMMRHTR
jgi:hypothetical protein